MKVKRNGRAGRGRKRSSRIRSSGPNGNKLMGIENQWEQILRYGVLRSRIADFWRGFCLTAGDSAAAVESEPAIDAASISGKRISGLEVEAEIEDNYEGKDGDLLIHFKVKRGSRRVWPQLSIEGVHAFKKRNFSA